ncbi:Mur ligase family protein [Nocardioides cremeus]|uniref:Mur ligase family protein n=1 Tax=Nocardioides cremeus TaxID=3058044 RepID=A0ABT8TQI1_9ACTN|nr:Mur ligase family protein [Nocardioides cremeus]MDO3396220.1 Mur ligase family protein [Nocardioides cremeus]
MSAPGAGQDVAPTTHALVELRVLEGPNLYFPRAAVKLTLDTGALATAPIEVVRVLAERIGLSDARPGEPGSGFRQRFALRAVARLVRAVAQESGTSSLAVRVRPTNDPHQVVVAYPWAHRERARSMGRAVASVLDVLVPGDDGVSTDRLSAAVSVAAETVATSEPGDGPTTLEPRVPVVAVTGTNGKTTTSRMVAHIGREWGKVVGWSNTDGVYVDGVLVEPGDYSGPSGAGRVLAHENVELAVTETARGGILLKGIGLTHNDVSVVTNVSADHLGLHGIDTLDQLAEVKAVVPRITAPEGWAVLNADDPRVLSMRWVVKSQVWVFSRDPDSPAVRDVLGDGGRATTVIDGWLCVLEPDADPDPLIELVDVPMTLAGLSHYNVENALAAASAALAVGIPRDVVVAGLRSFLPDAEHNPGRMNCFTVPVSDGEVTVVMDLAHNEAGLEAMFEIMHGIRPEGARVLLGLGVVGDRSEELIEKLGEIAARDADVVAIGHKERYFRGRTAEELEGLMRAGAERVGVTAVPAYPTEVGVLSALVGQALPGEVVGLMCHADREGVYEWIAEAGGVPDSAEVLAAKVRTARAG